MRAQARKRAARQQAEDAHLRRYSLVIIDEAHERTVHTDVLLGLLRRVLDTRPEGFRLIVMSATLDADAFAEFFRDARAVYVQGRQFPVQVRIALRAPGVKS